MSEIDTLVSLSRALGDPDRDLVILAEGNTSIRTAAGGMIVKASGSRLGTAVADDFVDIDTDLMLELLQDEQAGDDDVDRIFNELSPNGKRPSVEAMLHALCLDLGGATVVGHTHPISVNIILCSSHADRLASDVLFPEQVVILGQRPIFVPYKDPGLTLARSVRRELLEHIKTYGGAPKVIYLGNHGIFALGESAQEVLQITEMAVKVSRILGGTLAIGEPRPLPPSAIQRIDERPDEEYRRNALEARPR